MESSEEQETADQEETLNDEMGEGDAHDGPEGRNSAELVESSSEVEGSDIEDVEDFDSAFVHLSENTNAATLPAQQNFRNSDPFDEDDVDLKVLLAKPACFLIVGKPGCGKTTAAKKLANYWKCQLITPSDCLDQAIQQKTSLGLKAQQALQKGEIVGDEMVIQIMEERLNSPECQHYGYILDGFPFLSEEYMSYSDQMNLLKNLSLKPDVIINLRIPDMDLVNRRSGNKVDPLTNISYPKEKYAPEKGDHKKKDQLEDGEEGAEEEEAVQEEEEEEQADAEEDEFTPFDEDPGDLDEEVIQRLVTRPEDLPESVSGSISKFKDQLLVPIEDLMSDHDQQNLVEINAILDEKTVFRQIMQKLGMLPFRTAIVPMRLHGAEQEELPEDMDSEELFRQMAVVNHPAPRWRWRRSKWGRFCPVALKEGTILWGKPDFGVSFLDKMYFLSTEEAMKKFLKNPRPFLLPPQPKPPCRFAIVGPPLCGKTTLSYLLAKKYGAVVLDVSKLMKGKFAEARQKAIDDARLESTENAITQVKTQIEASQAAAKAEEEAARAAKQEEVNEEEEAEAEEAKDGDEEEEGNEPEQMLEEKNQEEDKEEDAPVAMGVLGEISEVPNEHEEVASEEEANNPVDEVDENHPEVQVLVAEAVKIAETKELELPPEVYAECIANAVKKLRNKMRKLSPFTPIHGGYVLDDFPRSRDQWTALQDKEIVIDEVICMQDNSEGGQYLLKRYYELNKEEIEAKITFRVEEEKRKQEELEEAARKAAAEEEERRRKVEEEAARLLAEEEAARKATVGEAEDDEEGAPETTEGQEEGQKTADEEEVPPSEAVEPTSEVEPVTTTDQGGETGVDATTTEQGPTEDAASEEAKANVAQKPKDAASNGEEMKDGIPFDAPEMEEFKEKRLEFEKEWPALSSSISSTCPIEPKVIGIDEGVSQEEIQDTAIKAIEDPFRYKPWEYTGVDMDEEEEDFENDQDGEEEIGEDEEDDEMLKKRKRPLGDAQHYCPVELKEHSVLFPGNSEIAAKYREKTFYFSTPDARDKFMRSPDAYVALEKPLKVPAMRLFMLGAKGAGKTTHARELAAKLGVFHISFLDRLQEMVIAKTKKKVLRSGEEDEDAEDPDEDMEEGLEGTEMGKGEITEVTEETTGLDEEKDVADELTDEEESIRAYLADDEPLPPDILETIVNQWWHREPFKSTGFILEGFPRLQDEVAVLQQSGLYPDCSLILTTEDSDVVDRLLPPKMNKWKVRRDKQLAKKQKQLEKKQKEREDAMKKRRDELLAEREARREERKKQRGGDDEEEDEEDDDIEAALAEEFEEEEAEEEEDEEQEADAMERIKGEISERYEDESNKLQGVIEALDEFMIPKLEINGGRKIKIVKYLINSKLEKLLTCRDSLFERVYPVSAALAKRLISSGHKHPSVFGKWDPVDLLNKSSCIQPLSGNNATYAAVYRQHVYFMSSATNRIAFMDQPRKFVMQPPPKASIPIQIAIIGAPKSGKTTLANRFVSEFGMVRLSIGEAIRGVLTNMPKSDLAAKMNEFLFRGKVLPDELAIQALQCHLLDMKCQTRGFVLDGYPLTERQIHLLNEQHIVPHKVIQLEVSNDEVLVRGAKDRLSTDKVLPLHDSHQILAIRLTAWQREIQNVIDWYKNEHDNFHVVDGHMSKWWIHEKSKNIAFQSVRATQVYMEKIYQGKAASIKNLCITPSEFESRLGVFGHYCPVSLALRNELCDCSTQASLDLAAEFRGKYYRMASESDLKEFLSSAALYVPPLARAQLPPDEDLPKRRTNLDVKAMFPKRIELQGYDPVAFVEGNLKYEAIVSGDAESYVAEYKKKLYCFASEHNLQLFMRVPERYSYVTLPQKLPPKKQPLSVAGLPMLGYLEQTVATAIVKSLTAVGASKPKHPFLSPTKSALIYVAYHLKANNTNASEFRRKKYKEKLQQFGEKCQLVPYLCQNMTVGYRDTQHRPTGFDQKMNSFVQLKEIKHNLSLI